MNKNLVLIKGLVASSVMLVSVNAPAQDLPMQAPGVYGQPPAMPAPMQGHYPAPPMNPQMMQQMMVKQKKKMQEMQARQQAEAAAQKKAMMAESKQHVKEGQRANCQHHGKNGMHGMMKH